MDYMNENMQEKWNRIILEISKQARDIATSPKTSRTPLWFNVSTDRTYILVNKAKEKNPSSKISVQRKLSYKEFLRIYPIHLKRERGEKVSGEAIKATVNQVYWFSIFKNYL